MIHAMKYYPVLLHVLSWVVVVLLYIFLVPTLLRAQTDTSYIIWEQTQQISFDPYTSVTPRIQASGDHVYLMWVAAATSKSFFARSTDRGVTWSAPTILPDTTEGYYNSNVFEDQGLMVYTPIIYRTGLNDYGVWVRRSSSGGILWEDGRLLFPGVRNAISASGTELSLAYFVAPFGEFERFAYSNDSSCSWVQFVQTLSPGSPPPAIQLVGSNLHIVREKAIFGTSEVGYSRSTDYGATWRPEVYLSTEDSLRSYAADIAANIDNNVYAVWMDLKYGSIGQVGMSVLLRISTDMGISWGTEQRLTDMPSGVGPRVSCNARFVGVVWDDEQSINNTRIFCRASFDRGESWTPVQNVTPASTTADGSHVAVTNEYVHVTWRDYVSGNSEIYYRRGRLVYTSVGESDERLPQVVQLFQNYPNPFNSETVIEYELPRRAHVRLEVFNVLGQRVRSLVDEAGDRGRHTVRWDAKNAQGGELSSGIYIVRLAAESTLRQRKLLLLR